MSATALLPHINRKPFGFSMWSLVFKVKGRLTKEGAPLLTAKIIEAIDMQVAPYDPVTWEYPVEGHGGTGVTHVRALTESLLFSDSYEEWGFVGLFSCVQYDPEIAYRACEEFGLEVSREGGIFKEVS